VIISTPTTLSEHFVSFRIVSYRINYMHMHGVMSRSLRHFWDYIVWTKTMRHRNYRPKTRSSQLNNVCTIIAAETETQLAAYSFLKSPYQTSNTNTLLIYDTYTIRKLTNENYLVCNISSLQATFFYFRYIHFVNFYFSAFFLNLFTV